MRAEISLIFIEFKSFLSIQQAALAEQQREDALNHVQLMTDKLDQLSIQNGSSLPRDLRLLSIQQLKGLQVRFSLSYFEYLVQSR